MESVFSDDDRIQLSFLRDVEVDALVASEHLPADCALDSPLDSTVQFTHPEVILHITPGPFYPVLLQSDGFIRLENLQLGRVPCDTLRARLLNAYDRALQTNTLSVWQAREELDPFGVFEPKMLILELASETVEFLKSHREAESRRLLKYHSGRLLPADRIQTKQLSEVRSASEMARELVGSPASVADRMPNHMRVLHIEEILRTDLAAKFDDAKKALKARLARLSPYALHRFSPEKGKRPDEIVADLVRPRVTFHGTTRPNVPSIVRHGFLCPGMPIPGAPENHKVRCGSTYGLGIYSSPSPEFSLSYSGWSCEPTPPEEYFGVKLIVCATLMGRAAAVSREDNVREFQRPWKGADSHVANREYEYIVFDPARILPVYVVHLDWGSMNEWHIPPAPTDPWQWQPSQKRGTSAAMALKDMAPGDKQRAKEQIMARARKWFPYGYGPFTKGNFVVEDVADVSEDEEHYGEYQSLRVTGGDAPGERNMEYWSWVKAGFKDEDDYLLKTAAARGLDEYTDQKLGKDTSFRAHCQKKWDSIPSPEELEDNGLQDDDVDLGLGALLFGHDRSD